MMTSNPDLFEEASTSVDLPIWKELRLPVEVLALHGSAIFRGRGAPRGDGSGVIVFPGFLMPDFYLVDMRRWLKRIGYRAYASHIGVNADCPNLLVHERLNDTLNRARRETGCKVHLVGHSLGGIIARSMAAQRPDDVASVNTLGSPFRGITVHRILLKTSRSLRKRILHKHNGAVLPECLTGYCTCEFVEGLRRVLPSSIAQTAIYTRSDGFVDWRHCITGDPAIDVEVPGTHIGLAFNVAVYSVLAQRLAAVG